jgi:hypothetical protein
VLLECKLVDVGMRGTRELLSSFAKSTILELGVVAGFGRVFRVLVCR